MYVLVQHAYTHTYISTIHYKHLASQQLHNIATHIDFNSINLLFSMYVLHLIGVHNMLISDHAVHIFS